MEQCVLSPRERLRHWRDFRKTFNNKQTDEEQLLAVAQYWSEWPEVSHYIDPDYPKGWPTPWEIIVDGTVCPNTIPLMMEQTLLLADDRWIPERLELLYVDEKQISTMFMLLVVDAKYVLNYSRNELKYFDNIKKSCIILNKYTPSNHYRHRLI